METFSEIANVPNAITTARLAGSVGEAVAYAHTGEPKHFIRSGAYFLLDVLDGPVARALDQETEFGAQEDPIVDKASIAALGIASVIQKKADTAPLIAVATVNASNTLATVVAKHRGTLDDGVTKDGKRSQFGMNTGFGLNVLGNHLRDSDRASTRKVGNAMRAVGGAISIGSAVSWGIRATTTYWKQALKPKA